MCWHAHSNEQSVVCDMWVCVFRYAPDGALLEAGLVAPEAQLATTPFVVSFLNGVTSLVDYGLTSCESTWPSPPPHTYGDTATATNTIAAAHESASFWGCSGGFFEGLGMVVTATCAPVEA